MGATLLLRDAFAWTARRYAAAIRIPGHAEQTRVIEADVL